MAAVNPFASASPVSASVVSLGETQRLLRTVLERYRHAHPDLKAHRLRDLQALDALLEAPDSTTISVVLAIDNYLRHRIKTGVVVRGRQLLPTRRSQLRANLRLVIKTIIGIEDVGALKRRVEELQTILRVREAHIMTLEQQLGSARKKSIHRESVSSGFWRAAPVAATTLPTATSEAYLAMAEEMERLSMELEEKNRQIAAFESKTP